MSEIIRQLLRFFIPDSNNTPPQGDDVLSWSFIVMQRDEPYSQTAQSVKRLIFQTGLIKNHCGSHWATISWWTWFPLSRTAVLFLMHPTSQTRLEIDFLLFPSNRPKGQDIKWGEKKYEWEKNASYNDKWIIWKCVIKPHEMWHLIWMSQSGRDGKCTERLKADWFRWWMHHNMFYIHLFLFIWIGLIFLSFWFCVGAGIHQSKSSKSLSKAGVILAKHPYWV